MFDTWCYRVAVAFAKTARAVCSRGIGRTQRVRQKSAAHTAAENTTRPRERARRVAGARQIAGQAGEALTHPRGEGSLVHFLRALYPVVKCSVHFAGTRASSLSLASSLSVQREARSLLALSRLFLRSPPQICSRPRRPGSPHQTLTLNYQACATILCRKGQGRQEILVAR